MKYTKTTPATDCCSKVREDRSLLLLVVLLLVLEIILLLVVLLLWLPLLPLLPLLPPGLRKFDPVPVGDTLIIATYSKRGGLRGWVERVWLEGGLRGCG